MKIKNLYKIAIGIAIATSLTNSFAMDTNCPSTETIRSIGSNFLYAYGISADVDNRWVLLSEPFSEYDVNWQTIYTSPLPWSVTDTNAAIKAGKKLFDQSPLLTTGPSTTTAGKVECLYTDTHLNYEVKVVSPPPYGIR